MKFKLTPIEKHQNIYFKRDDLFKIDDSPLNGGKLRQCYNIFLNNHETIKKDFNSTVVTPTSVKSPQGVIVTKIAKLFNFHPILVVGNVDDLEKSIKINKSLRISKESGAEIINCSSQGFNTVLNYHVRELQKTRKMFNIGFGLKGTRQDIIDPIADQVQNIPENISSVIIPAGSGYSSSGIIEGLTKFKKDHIKNIVVIQPFGYDRRKNIVRNISFYPFEYKYKYYKGNYPYSKPFKYNYGNLELDEIYESKAFDFMEKNIIKDLTEDVLFWIVGNTNWMR